MADPVYHMKQALKRSRNSWNWCVQRIALVCLLLALGFNSALLFATGIIFLGVSLFELHLPDMPGKTVWNLMRMERDWLDSPWRRRKRIQAVFLALLLILLLWSLAVGDLALIMLAVVIAALLWVESSQARYMDWAERDDAERADAERKAEEQRLRNYEVDGPEQ